MTIEYVKDRHLRASRMLGYVLTLSTDAEAWSELAIVFERRLTEFERSCLLAAVIGSMDLSQAFSVAKAVHQRTHIGMPLPPFLDAATDAVWWADHASLDERKALLAAAFLSLPVREREAFLDHTARRAAA